jgi:hypothetical protein
MTIHAICTSRSIVPRHISIPCYTSRALLKHYYPRLSAGIIHSSNALNATLQTQRKDPTCPQDSHAHATTSTAKIPMPKSNTRSREDPPVACTSNGDPPPESAFESCAFGGRVGRAALVDGAGGCTAPVDDAAVIDVGFGSTTIPSDDELDACAWDCELPAAADVDVEVETEVKSELARVAALVALVVVVVVAAALLGTALDVVVVVG